MIPIATVPALLKIANVAQLSLETLPKILNTITDNKIRLEDNALKAVVQLLNSAPEAMTKAYEAISQNLQKALDHTDKQSIDYINNLINSFKSAGMSDKRMYKLLDKTTTQEHEIRTQKTAGWFTIAKIFSILLGIIIIIPVAGFYIIKGIETSKPHKKIWER